MHRRPLHIKPRSVVLSDGRVLTVKSGLEAALAKQIDGEGVRVRYEEERVEYQVPERTARYTWDFKLPNGIIVEGKGEFDAKDRAKHLLVKEQHPALDIRFVFNNPNSRLYKGSPTTYAKWCDSHGFKYAAKVVPQAWFKE